MSKVKESCPVCQTKCIVVLFNEPNMKAWPSCWSCGFQGYSEQETAALTIHVLSSKKMNKEQIFKEATENWNEYLLLLREEEEQGNIND